jgi:hypothetical protein
LEQSQKGWRKYLNTRTQSKVGGDDNPVTGLRRSKAKLGGPVTKKTTERYSPAHHKEALNFVRMLQHRIASVALTDRDKPLQFPLVEIAYAKRCIDRLKDHKRHSSSNYVMNLTEAICAALAHEFGTLFAIEQAVIYLIWLPEQTEISEIGFTKLAESYTHNAGGFSNFPRRSQQALDKPSSCT